MADRLSVWVGAGVITAGMSAALLAGAGVATATTDSQTSGATSASASELSAQSEPETDHADEADHSDEAEDAGESDDADGPEPDEVEAEGVEVGDLEVGDVEVGDADDSEDESGDRPLKTGPEAPAAREDDVAEPGDEAVDETVAVEEVVVAEESATAIPAEGSGPAAERAVEATTESTSVVRPLASSKAADAQESATVAPRQTLLSAISTVIFNIYTFAVRVLGGPPMLPWGSSVTVRSSSLRIDCGDGYDVAADWYVPEGATPTRLIYLQHGFLASGAFYSHTAARLAEATDSIVVATSMTSNFLSCDGCWVGGSPMHRAVAGLFVDGNTALAQSALAAGYSSTLLDGVSRVALIGHSAGGGLAAGTAGYMTQNGSFDRLAGVVMLDGVGFGDVTPQALAKLPTDFPIYNLAARAYFWNLSGITNDAMETWRPGEFNGVKLADSSHGDAMTGGNLLVQVAMNLVTGWPKPGNVKAAEKISAGWLNDMFTGTTASGFYGAPDETLQIETSRGTATAYVLPGPTQRPTFIDWLFALGATILFGIDFATCAVDPDEVSTEIAPFSAPDTLLSLDGRAKPRQSNAQQCLHG
ncbi:hypothetical protein [Mycolicibacterium austroafricanum]|uniref:hypothetical protein n=1 Tax=Mycolicibacterium austroafricanum TaxID=39687 RepID=UPI001CA340BF|nr:hypothetical protein [Mycolicibacterium austroafricanum]QZT63295.1 hypothetical protein JN085_02520 [Mycolicibacterium austroafricanum]